MGIGSHREARDVNAMILYRGFWIAPEVTIFGAYNDIVKILPIDNRARLRRFTSNAGLSPSVEISVLSISFARGRLIVSDNFPNQAVKFLDSLII